MVSMVVVAVVFVGSVVVVVVVLVELLGLVVVNGVVDSVVDVVVTGIAFVVFTRADDAAVVAGSVVMGDVSVLLLGSIFLPPLPAAK